MKDIEAELEKVRGEKELLEDKVAKATLVS